MYDFGKIMVVFSPRWNFGKISAWAKNQWNQVAFHHTNSPEILHDFGGIPLVIILQSTQPSRQSAQSAMSRYEL